MALSLSSDVIVLILGVVLAALYLFRDQLFSSSPKPKTSAVPVKETTGQGNPRDFVAKMKAGVSRFFSTFQLRPVQPFVEKASCHLLRIANWDRRRIRHSHRQGSQVQVRSRFPRL